MKNLLLALTLGLSLASCAPTAQNSTPKPAPVTSTPTPAPVKPAPVTSTPVTAQPVTAAPAPRPAPVTSAPADYRQLAYLTAQPVRRFNRAEQVIDPARSYRAVLVTGKGDITLDLNAKAAPAAVNNFVFLALNHFYDNTRFHRVIAGFMAQGGDPQSTDLALKPAWGTGGPGYTFTAETKSGLRFNRAGVLGMARAASLDSQGSQFFITLADADFLSGGYTVFGQVTAGLNILNDLTKTAQGTPAGEQPIPGVVADTLRTVQIFVK